MDIRDYKDYETPDSRRGQLTRIGAIDYGDSDNWLAKLRRQVRNPSLLTFFIMAIVALSIPLAIVAPGFYSGAKEGIVRIRQDPFVQFLEVSTPSHVYPYLQRNIQLMKTADTQSEWRRISFKLGPCHEANLAQFPEGNTPPESPKPATTSTTSNSNSPTTASPKHPAISHQQPSPA